MPDLEDRVAALEELVRFPPQIVTAPSLTEEEAERFKVEFEAAMGDFRHQPPRILPSPPPLTSDQVRQLLRECITVVKPGETLVIRVPATWNPMQVREYAEAVYDGVEYLDLPFKAFVVTGDELAVADPTPGFMPGVRADAFRNARGAAAVRLTHLPTGVIVEAETRAEAVAKLGRALKRRGVPGAA